MRRAVAPPRRNASATMATAHRSEHSGNRDFAKIVLTQSEHFGEAQPRTQHRPETLVNGERIVEQQEREERCPTRECPPPRPEEHESEAQDQSHANFAYWNNSASPPSASMDSEYAGSQGVHTCNPWIAMNTRSPSTSRHNRMVVALPGVGRLDSGVWDMRAEIEPDAARGAVRSSHRPVFGDGSGMACLLGAGSLRTCGRGTGSTRNRPRRQSRSRSTPGLTRSPARQRCCRWCARY